MIDPTENTAPPSGVSKRNHVRAHRRIVGPSDSGRHVLDHRQVVLAVASRGGGQQQRVPWGTQTEVEAIDLVARRSGRGRAEAVLEVADHFVVADALEHERRPIVETVRLPDVSGAAAPQPMAAGPTPTNPWGARPRWRHRPPGSPVVL